MMCRFLYSRLACRTKAIPANLERDLCFATHIRLMATSNKLTALSNEEILYKYYSYDAPQYVIDVLKRFYETYAKQGRSEPLFDKKCNILKFEIVARFCHYAEALGSFLYPCNFPTPTLRPEQILENLSKYKVFEIDQFYQQISNQSYTLDRAKYNNFSDMFGYDRIHSGQGAEQLVDKSLTNIISVLKAIGEFYEFWKAPYNAFKHGYRLWFGDEQQQGFNVVVHLKKFNKLSPRNDMEPLPIDDKTINDVHDFSGYCRHIFDVIFNNHKALLNATNSRIYDMEFTFLEYNEPITSLNKKRLRIT
jgi:hypothetical protein